MKILWHNLSVLTLAVSAIFLGAMVSQGQITNFSDSFPGPTLDPSWSVEQTENGDVIGFQPGGGYEVQCQINSNVSGLLRGFKPGSGTNAFTVDVTVNLPSIAGSDTDYMLRIRGPNDIEFHYNSSDQIRVWVNQLSENIVQINNVGYTPGQPLNFRITYDGNGNLNVGYSIGTNAPLTLIGSCSGIQTSIANETQLDVILNKNDPNGSTAIMDILHYDQVPGVVPIGIPTYTDNFSGPTLNANWSVVGNPTNQIGFTNGEYEIQDPNVGTSDGLSRPLGGVGSFTVTTTATLTNFVGSGTEYDVLFPSAGSIEVSLLSSGDLAVYSQELGGNVAYYPKFGYKDGDKLTAVLSYDSFNDIVYAGVSLNGGPLIFLANVQGLSEFSPSDVQIQLNRTSAGNGSNPMMSLEYFQSGGSVEAIAPTPFSQSGPPLDPSWFTIGPPADQLGFNSANQYVVRGASGSTNGLGRALGFIDGDFTAQLNVNLTNFIGSGSALEFQFPGTNEVDVVYKGSDDLSIYMGGVLQKDYGPLGLSDGGQLILSVSYQYSTGNLLVGAGLLSSGSLTEVASFVTPIDFIPTVNNIVLAGSGNALMQIDSYSLQTSYETIPNAVTEFDDEFNGPNLDPSWTTVDGAAEAGGPPALIGFNGQGQYEILNYTNHDSYLSHQLGSGGPYGSYTVDWTAEFPVLLSTTTDFKVLMEESPGIAIVFNSGEGPNIRADVDGGTGGNSIPTTTAIVHEMTNGSKLEGRFTYNALSGQARIFLNPDNEGWQLLGTINGLIGSLGHFDPSRVELDTYKWGSGTNTLEVLMDHFQIYPGVYPPSAGITVTRAANKQLTLNWLNGAGPDAGDVFLETAPQVTGPWTVVPGASSPYTVTPTGNAAFFRIEPY